jgi:hypothetical protein
MEIVGGFFILVFLYILVTAIGQFFSWIIKGSFRLLFSPFKWAYKHHRNYRRHEEIAQEVLESYGLSRYQYNNLIGEFFHREVERKIEAKRSLEGV